MAICQYFVHHTLTISKHLNALYILMRLFGRTLGKSILIPNSTSLYAHSYTSIKHIMYIYIYIYIKTNAYTQNTHTLHYIEKHVTYLFFKTLHFRNNIYNITRIVIMFLRIHRVLLYYYKIRVGKSWENEVVVL